MKKMVCLVGGGGKGKVIKRILMGFMCFLPSPSIFLFLFFEKKPTKFYLSNLERL